MARRKHRQRDGLRRRTDTRTPKRTFVILCEGKRTEPDYLDALKRLPEVRDAAAVQVEIRRAFAGYAPLSLVTAAANVKERGAEIDEVWCLFDVEAPRPHPNLKEAVSLARDRGVELAVSNPCFEIWLALHFKLLSSWLTTAKAVEVRHALDSSDDKEVDGERYMPLRWTAALHARDLHDRHLGNGTQFPANNPSSGMFRLLEAIERDTTDDDPEHQP